MPAPAAPTALQGCTPNFGWGWASWSAVRWSRNSCGRPGWPGFRDGRPAGTPRSRVRSEDLVNRNFLRTQPNVLWVCDITEHPTWEGKLYCCAVLDAFSRKIVGWSIESSQNTAPS
nr:DDE-type integrase/transposase/recombinase [Amycolatopsis coloradensis]